MASTSMLLFSIVVLYLAFTVVVPLPVDKSGDWLLPINKLLLYNIVKSSCAEGCVVDKPVCHSVLTNILHEYDITENAIDTVANSLLGYIRQMFSELKKAKSRGGGYFQKVLDKWKHSDYKLKLGGAKRKLEYDIHVETKRRKICEEAIKEERAKVKALQKENKNIVNKLLKKTRKSAKTDGQTKKKYSKAHIKRERKKLLETAFATVQLLESVGVKITTLNIRDKFGNKAKLKYNALKSKKNKKLPIDKAVHLKDSLCLSDDDYKELARTLKKLPSLKMVKKRCAEIDQLFPVIPYEDMIGAYEPLQKKISFIVNQMATQYAHESVPDHIGIKLSGDGTMIGKRIHAVNLTVKILYGKHCSGEYLLAMVRKPEKYQFLSKMWAPIISNLPNDITVNDQTIPLKYHLGADLKFLNEMMGIGACNSTHSCLWCKCPSNERYLHTKKWSMLDPELGARTIEEITNLSQQSRTKNMSCRASPILSFIPVHCVVADPLHLFLRISDQLVNQLIQILRHKDNIGRNSRILDLTNCQNIANFENFVRNLSIPWSFFTNKENGKLQYRDFTGPEHLKIQQHIKIEDLIPWHSKMGGIKWLWEEFGKIMSLMKSDGVDTNLVESRSRAWVSKYAQVFQAKDVTPYMHVLMNHVSESIKLHGCINQFTQQAMEKLNDKVTSLFFRASNHKNTEAFIQVMKKQNRISYLDAFLKGGVVFVNKCGKCGQSGHNKRTCHLKYRPQNEVQNDD